MGLEWKACAKFPKRNQNAISLFWHFNKPLNSSYRCGYPPCLPISPSRPSDRFYHYYYYHACTECRWECFLHFPNIVSMANASDTDIYTHTHTHTRQLNPNIGRNDCSHKYKSEIQSTSAWLRFIRFFYLPYSAIRSLYVEFVEVDVPTY